MLILNHKESLEFPPFEEVPLTAGALDLISSYVFLSSSFILSLTE
jgi:hypothetical protein